MRGTVNMTANRAQGAEIPPEFVNDLSTLLASCDDDRLFDQIRLEPPAAASPRNVNVAFMGLARSPGPLVLGDAAARQVTVRPLRAMRSSTSQANPRAMLSACTTVDQVVALPAAPPASVSPAGAMWGWLLLYAEISYVDASEPTKGTQLAFYVAEPSAYAFETSAPTFATLPAHTASSWNVPIRWIKSYSGQTTIALEDLIEVPSSVALSRVSHDPLQARDRAHHHRRAHSSANSDPTGLVTGGSSAWATRGIDQTFTPTRQPAMAGRREIEVVDLEVMIPSGTNGGGGPTAGTGGAAVEVVVDDSRDWRGALFSAEWSIRQATGTNAYFAEDDDGVTAPANRTIPGMVGSSSLHMTSGNSLIAVTPHALFGSKLWASVVANNADVPGAGSVNGVANALLAVGDGWGLFVDASTGALKFWGKRAGVADGPALYVLLQARWPGR